MGLILKFLKALLKGKPKPPKVPPAKKTPAKPGCKTNCDKPNPYTSRTREQNLKSKKSYEDLIAEHKKKLEDYRRNPGAHDNDGRWTNAPTPEIRQKIYEGRLKALGDQITKQQGELAKVIEALGG